MTLVVMLVATWVVIGVVVFLSVGMGSTGMIVRIGCADLLLLLLLLVTRMIDTSIETSSGTPEGLGNSGTALARAAMEVATAAAARVRMRTRKLDFISLEVFCVDTSSFFLWLLASVAVWDQLPWCCMLPMLL